MKAKHEQKNKADRKLINNNNKRVNMLLKFDKHKQSVENLNNWILNLLKKHLHLKKMLYKMIQLYNSVQNTHRQLRCSLTPNYPELYMKPAFSSVHLIRDVQMTGKVKKHFD